MKANCLVLVIGAAALCVVLALVSRMSAFWTRDAAPRVIDCGDNAVAARDGGGGSGSGNGVSSEEEKVRCYNWLESDIQSCEYLIAWLAQNNVAEDARTGHTPTPDELAERAAVRQKSLFCSIDANAQSSLFSKHDAFRLKFLAPATTTAAAADAAAPAAEPVAYAQCGACPTCAVCPEPEPAPAPAPTPAPAAAGGAFPSAAALGRPRGVGEVAPSTERRVISMGLYGNSPRYVNGALRNAELAPSVMPGWRVRIYHDDSVSGSTLTRLKELGCELVRMTDIRGGIAGMFWRFLVADDSGVDRYIVRDSDSRLTAREALAVQEWIDSGKKFHILRDHPSHSNYKISGGIWGGMYDPEIRMAERMRGHHNKDAYVEDMNFLRDQVYPVMLKSLIAHDAYSCSACGANPTPPGCRWGSFPHSVPFPSPRIGEYHCGQVFDGEDRGRQGDMDIIKNSPPPSVCTPPFANTK